MKERNCKYCKQRTLSTFADCVMGTLSGRTETLRNFDLILASCLSFVIQHDRNSISRTHKLYKSHDGVPSLPSLHLPACLKLCNVPHIVLQISQE
eukprot:138146-Hanusia_phi.AAC.1